MRDLLSEAIVFATAAHDGMRRRGGVLPYIVHPMEVGAIIGTMTDKQEVIAAGLLHDVVEDSNITLDDIADVYFDCGFETHFSCNIRKSLNLITHNKEDDYFVYIEKMMRDPVASLVKFMDLADNMNPVSLNCFGKEEFERLQKYTCCAFMINEYWHFLESIQKYNLEKQ
jgi:(p)ppGpp synthase/HD superfamily hydrolase